MRIGGRVVEEAEPRLPLYGPLESIVFLRARGRGPLRDRDAIVVRPRPELEAALHDPTPSEDARVWREAFLADQELHKKLDHRSFLRTIESSNVAAAAPHCAFEAFPGAPLDLLLDAFGGRLPPVLAVRIARELAELAAHLAERGARDSVDRLFLPGAILISLDGAVKLIPPFDHVWAVEVTPENDVRYELGVTRDPVFRIGSVLFGLLVGRVRASAPPPPAAFPLPSSVDPELERFDAVVHLATAQSGRYQDVRQLANALGRIDELAETSGERAEMRAFLRRGVPMTIRAELLEPAGGWGGEARARDELERLFPIEPAGAGETFENVEPTVVDMRLKKAQIAQRAWEGLLIEAPFDKHELTPTVIDMLQRKERTRALGRDGREMVVIPPGSFLFGPEGRRAETGAYLIDRLLVTNEAYARFVKETGRRPPPSWRSGRAPVDPAWPVVGVSLADASAYAAWANKRLATEAEWEKAARGVDGRVWPWGGLFEAGRCDPGWQLPAEERAPVREAGAFSPGADSPFGLGDLCRVWEWTSSVEKLGGSTCPVVRGGAWRGRVEPPRLTNRTFEAGEPSDVGFRCAADLSLLAAAPP